MENKLNETLFKLNTVLLSAFGPEAEESKEFISENDKLYPFMSEKSKQEYNYIKSGASYSLAEEDPPTEESARYAFETNNFGRAYIEYATLFKNNPDNIEYLKKITQTLIILGVTSPIEKFLLKDLMKYKADQDILQLIAEYYVKLDTEKGYKKAVPLFEKLVKIKKSFGVLFQLSYCLERGYQDVYIDRAIELAKESLTLANEYEHEVASIQLAKNHSDIGEPDIALKYLDTVTSEKNMYEAAFFRSYVNLKAGRIKDGYDAYRVRFEAQKTEYPLSLKSEMRAKSVDDIKDKTVLVQFEQGFGDSIMFSRYVKQIAELAAKTYFVCPNNLYTLFVASGFNDFCYVVPPNKSIKKTKKQVMSVQGHELNDIEFDYHVPLMDSPYILGTSKNDIGSPEGWLFVSEEDIKEFREKHINKNKKLKIGISYHGTKSSNQTYRDIPAKEFIPLFEMDNVEFYSFQLDEHSKEVTNLMKHYDNLTSFKDTFNDFKDTACAIKNMDLIITTDNVIMNLSGALGAKTYAIFNVYTEPRWYKTTGNDIGWYTSVKPFQAKTFNDWENVVKDIKTEIIKEFKLKP